MKKIIFRIGSRLNWAITLVVVLFTFTSFAQINVRRVQNSVIINLSTNDTISNHSSDVEAIQQLLNLKQQGFDVEMRGSIYNVDLTDVPCPTFNMIVVDTISKVVFNYGSVRGKERAVLDDCKDIFVVVKDSAELIPYYSFTMEMEETKSWPEAKSTYRFINTPFYFYKSDSVYRLSTTPDIQRIRTFANREHCVSHYINGVQVTDTIISCNPGNSTYAGGSFRHSNSFILDDTIDNVIRIEAIDEDSGEILGSRQFIILKK